MKHKTRTKALSWLLSLAMLFSVVPGLSLTAYADNTETLLTTITATGKEQASYSVANVATVSFSYTTNGSSSYMNNGKTNWGWWGYGWTATVNAAQGYTITKCIFYDDANRPATDSEAPFVVETTEQEKEPRVNGTPILAYTSKGITKIDVYGYAVTEYPIWVGGTQVTSENASNIDGSNKASYDAETKTLTLNGYSYNGTGYGDKDNIGIYSAIYAKQDLIIEVTGTNDVKNISATQGSAYYYSVFVTGKLKITGNGTLNAKEGIRCQDAITINGGTVNAEVTGEYGSGIDATADVTIKDCTVTAIGKNNGISARNGDIFVSGGTVTATGNDGYGIKAETSGSRGHVAIGDSVVVTASGTEGAISAASGVTNAVAGTGWTNKEGTEGKADIAVNTEGQSLTYKKVQFLAHTHDFTYSATGATITATCGSEDGCPLASSGYKTTLTIAAPTLTTYDGTGDAAATLTGLDAFKTATGKTIAATEIKYVGRDGTSYAESTTAPTNAGKYTAKITVESKTASVDYEIEKVNQSVTAPTAKTDLVYNGESQKLINEPAVTNGNNEGIRYQLNSGDWTANTPYATGAGTYTVSYKVLENENFNEYAGTAVTVTIAKANQTVDAPTGKDNLVYTGNSQQLINNPPGITKGNTLSIAQYKIGSGGAWSTSLPTGTAVGAYTVYYKIEGNNNYNEFTDSITVSIAKAASPVTVASTASVTKGNNTVDLSANVTMNGATGTVSYEISGEANGCSVDASTGVFTSGTNAGSVTVNVSVAADDNYNALAATPIMVTINDKATQTLAFSQATQTKTFGDADFTITAAHTTGDGAVTYAITSGDAATVNETTGEVHIVKAGSATVTARAAETSTYAEKTASYTLTVNKKDLTVKADAKSVIYGNPPPALTYTATGLVGSDTLTGALACSATKDSNAGEYDITQETLSASENYNLTFVGAKLKVLKAAQSRPASGEGYSIDASTKAITITDGFEVINDQGEAIESGATVTLNKTYSIRKSGNTNYTPSPYTDFTVASVRVTATASPAAGGSVTGADSYMVGASVTLTAKASNGYQFKEWLNESGISIGTNSTYTFKAAKNTSITAVFMQTEKTIVQIPTATNKTFNDAEQTGVTATANCTVSGGTATNVGSYTATATLTDTEHYVWSDGTSAPKSITWSIYKASQPRPSVTVNNETHTATIGMSGQGKVEYKLASVPVTDYQQVNDLSIAGLSENTTYHVRYEGNDNYLPSSATIVKVGNPYVAPTVKTNAVSNLTATTATISGTKTDGKDTSGEAITPTLKLRYDTNAGLSGATVVNNSTVNLTGLMPNTTYYYQAYATDTIYGEILSFKTPASAPAATGQIDVSVSTSSNKDVYVTVEQGNDVIAASAETAVNNTTHLFPFNKLPNGTYNVVVRTTDGKYAETHIITISTGASTQATSFTVLEGNGTLEAVVDIKTADTPKVAADGIRDTITSEEATLIQNGELSVKTALDVEKKTSDTASGASDIQTVAGSDKTVDLFLDLSLIKTTSELAGDVVVGVMEEDIGAKNEIVLQIAIPYADAAKEGLEVYRYHGSTASTLKSLTAKPSDGFVDGTFFADTANKYLFIYAKDFSTYAVGYTTPAAPYTPTYSSGSSATYTIEVSGNTDNGKVTLSKAKAQSGEKITVTVKPDTGCAVGAVTATDANGKSVSVTKTSDTTYTFTMPSSKVTVNATFTNGACPQDATCPVSKFVDADAKAWYHDGVHWALENSVMNGVSPKYFNPNGGTSRAMVVTMLWRMEGSPAYVGMSEFTDVDNEPWYGQAVRWASAEGIVEGYTRNGSKVFNPDGAVTREQLATILYRYAQYKKQDVSVGEDTNILSYDDAFSVSTWAMAAMQWACGSGIINGIGSELVPAGNATRAQVATMLMRYSTNK